MIEIKKLKSGLYKFTLKCDRCNTVINSINNQHDLLSNVYEQLLGNNQHKCQMCIDIYDKGLYPTSIKKITDFLQESRITYNYIEDLASIKIEILYPLIREEEDIINNMLSLEIHCEDINYQDNIIKYSKL